MSNPPNRTLVTELDRRGLAAAAALLVGAHRPLRPLVSDLATFLGPVLAPLLGDRLDGLRAALADDEAYEALLAPAGPER